MVDRPTPTTDYVCTACVRTVLLFLLVVQLFHRECRQRLTRPDIGGKITAAARVWDSQRWRWTTIGNERKRTPALGCAFFRAPNKFIGCDSVATCVRPATSALIRAGDRPSG
uniref:Secreted protein n=1 Tax=Plectus sambesii TaxID=2011161 RepID=A0A914VR87_9BILA